MNFEDKKLLADHERRLKLHAKVLVLVSIFMLIDAVERIVLLVLR